VWAGVRKSSDAAIGMFAELSANLNTNNGTFYLAAPVAAAAANYTYNSKGTISAGSGHTNSEVAAPVSNVVSAISKISTDTAIFRVNGTQKASISADQGTGNYGNYKLYFGRRGGTTLPFNGRDYGIIICGKTASNDELTNYEQWLNTRMGRIY